MRVLVSILAAKVSVGVYAVRFVGRNAIFRECRCLWAEVLRCIVSRDIP